MKRQSKKKVEWMVMGMESWKGSASFREVRQGSLRLFPVLGRIFLMGFSWFLVTWSWTTWWGSLGGLCGVVLGVLWGDRLGASALRAWMGVILLLLLGVLGWGLAEGVVTWDWSIALLGSSLGLELAEVLRWGSASWGLVGILRLMSVHFSAWGVLELLLPFFGVASLFASHRFLRIHRPQGFADWATERGEDPTWYLLLMGLGLGLCLAVGMMRLRYRRQWLGGLLLMILLFGGGVWFLGQVGSVQIGQWFGQGQQKKSSGGRGSGK
ncbi:MAG: hypothetical protein AAGJ35_07185, partial [Myxococcota bacterium]